MNLPTGLLAQASSELTTFALLAQEDSSGASYGVAWALVLLAIILGVIVSVRPDKREDELKKGG